MAQNNGGIDAAMYKEISESYKPTTSEKALQNILMGNPIKTLSLNQENLGEMNTHFSHSVSSKGITNQESSGRCWLFTGMNVMRAKMIAEQDLGAFQFSQVYNFFFDQLEKSNLFLQGIIDTRKKPKEDRVVDWLFKNPLSDGGTYTGVADLVAKYGIVPKGLCPKHTPATTPTPSIPCSRENCANSACACAMLPTMGPRRRSCLL